MPGAAHPDAMAPPKKGATRTAPPQMPSTWWSAPRIRNYLLFDATGVIYLLIGFLVLRLVWALGKGPEAWNAALASLSNPIYIAFHAVTLVSVIFVAVRFFDLFPKAQPPSIGPAKPPPAAVIKTMLYLVWAGITVGMSLILAGVIL
jgi:fumarate reductase subunit C